MISKKIIKKELKIKENINKKKQSIFENSILLNKSTDLLFLKSLFEKKIKKTKILMEKNFIKDVLIKLQF